MKKVISRNKEFWKYKLWVWQSDACSKEKVVVEENAVAFSSLCRRQGQAIQLSSSLIYNRIKIGEFI